MSVVEVIEEVKPKRKTVRKAVQDADFNARKRDEMDANGGYTQSGIDEMQETATRLLNEIEAATGKTIGLHSVKPKSKVRFAQIIQANVQHLIKNNVLSNAEKAFLFDITAFVTFKSNAIGIQKKGEYIPFLQKDIALNTGRTERSVRGILKSLHEKGIIYEGSTAIADLNVKGRSYLVNPNIIYNGDKNEVEETLKFLFSEANKSKFLKDLPVKMFK